MEKELKSDALGIGEKNYSRQKLYLLKRRTDILLIFYKTQSV